MPEPVKPAEGGAPAEPVKDVFGAPSDNKLPPPPKVEEQKKDDPNDIEKNPLVIELRGQLKSTKDSMGGNLAAQGKKIKNLEKQIQDAIKGGSMKPNANGAPGDLPFKDIKRSKDLTQEERDEMTDKELKQMDTIADLQEAQNKAFTDGKADEGEEDEEDEEGEEDGEEPEPVKNLNASVKKIAKELAGGDVDIANQIIESAKQFKLEGLDEETLKERMATAHKLIPNYQPPKEQVGTKGKTVKPSGKNDEDPFGNQKIVDEATKPADQSFTL